MSNGLIDEKAFKQAEALFYLSHVNKFRRGVEAYEAAKAVEQADIYNTEPKLNTSYTKQPVDCREDYEKWLLNGNRFMTDPYSIFKAGWDARTPLAREIVDAKPGILPINIDETLEALHTQYQFRSDAIVPRNSADAPTIRQHGFIRDAHLNLIPILKKLKWALSKIEGGSE